MPLLHLKHVESAESPFHRGLATAVGEVGIVDARLGTGVDNNPPPVARSADIRGVAVGVEGAAGPKAVVSETCEDDALPRRPLGNQLGIATLQLDAGPQQLDHHPRIDQQPTGGPGQHLATGGVIPPGTPGDHQVFLDHIGDVGALEAGRDIEHVDRAAEVGVDTDEETVDRVGQQPVAVDFRAVAAVGVLEGVGVGRDPGPGAKEHLVEGQRRPGADQMERGERLQPGIDEDVATAVAERRLADGIEKQRLGG